MKALTTALYSKFTALTAGVHNDFYNDIGGRLYDTQADQDAPMPYAVYLVVSDVPEYAFVNKPSEERQIQISLFSNASSSTEIKDMYTHCKALFDNASLTISGASQLLIDRIGSDGPTKDEDGNWQLDIDYRIITQETT